MHENFPNNWEGANILSIAQQDCNTSWQSLVSDFEQSSSLNAMEFFMAKKSWYILRSIQEYCLEFGAEVWAFPNKKASICPVPATARC